MNCTFCHRNLNRQIYTCSCDDSTLACQGCRQYGCYQCKADLLRVQSQFCVGCKQHKQASKMFGQQYNGFCFSCCLKAYKNTTGKKVILCNHIFEPDKYQVYTFLKKFCYRCSKNLAKQRPTGLDSGLRQIYPLDNNLCRKCSQNETQKQNAPRFNSSRVFKKEDSLNNQFEGQKLLKKSRIERQFEGSNSNSRSKIFSNQPERKERESQIKQTPEQKWKRVQGSTFIRCMACDFLILQNDGGFVDYDIALCKYCVKKSKFEDNNFTKSQVNNRKNYNDNLTSDSYVTDRRYQAPYQRSSSEAQFDYYDPYKERKQNQNQKNSQIKISTSRISKKQQQRIKTPPKPPKNNSPIKTGPVPTMKKHDSQQIKYNVPIQIRYQKDSEFVSCQKCRIQIMPHSAIWEQTTDKPFCRGCYLDISGQLIKQAQRGYQNQIINQEVKNTNYSPKQQRKIVDNSRNNLSTKYSPKEKAVDLQIEPIIHEEQRQTIINRIKKSASWDDNIIMEPIEDHERRKRQTKRSQDNKIVEETQEDQIRFSYSGNSQEEESNKKNIMRKQVQKPIQPEIIDDDEYKKKQRLQKRQSWDETIILEPISPQKIRKSKQNAQNITTTTEYKKQQVQIKQSEIKAKKHYSQQENQPVIIEEEQSKPKLKKMTSWDENILLQPLADHLERKKEKISQQNQTKSSTTQIKKETTKNQPFTNTKQDERLRKQYKFEQRVSSREKMTKQTSKEKQIKSNQNSYNQNQYRAATSNNINNPNYYPQNNNSRYTSRIDIPETSKPDRNSNSSSNLNANSNYYQKPASTTASRRREFTENERVAHDQYNNFEKKIQDIKKQLDQGMNESFSKLLGKNSSGLRSPYREPTREPFRQPIRQPQNLGRRQIPQFYRQNQNLGRSAAYRSPYQSFTPVQSQYYYSPYQKNDDRSTQYSQSNFSQSRVREPDYFNLSRSRANDPYLYSPYTGMETSNVRQNPGYGGGGGYTKVTRHDGLTGFTKLERRQNRVCGLCDMKFIAMNNDYFIEGDNVCKDCYGKNQIRF